jgi:hypothetical protein
MSHKFLSDANFHLLLTKIDEEFSEEVKQKGCPDCGGMLHQANYPRSPLGMPLLFRDLYERRLSFCCEVCRKRTTSPSVRFFGRRWYPMPLLILISLLTLGINKRRQTQIQRYFGISVSLSTWKRWRQWWEESFMTTLFWQEKRWIVHPLQINGPFPRAFLEVFQGKLEDTMCLILRFLSPLTIENFKVI